MPHTKAFLRTFMAAVLIASLWGGQARANDFEVGQGFALPTYVELMQSIIVLGGLDINDNRIADEYGKMVYCSLFKKNYKNDFEWNKIRSLIVGRILEKKEMFRLQYEIYGEVFLDRYDFENQIFPLTQKSSLLRIGIMNVIPYGEYETYCPGSAYTPEGIFPRYINVEFTQLLMVEGLKMPMDEAERLLNLMQEMNIKERKLHARFRVRLVDTPRMVQESGRGAAIAGAHVIAQISAIDFFLDRDMSMWVASAVPGGR